MVESQRSPSDGSADAMIDWTDMPELYPGEAKATALMMLRLGYPDETVVEALSGTFPPDCNPALVVDEAWDELRRQDDK